MKYLFSLLIVLIGCSLNAQNISSGPMLGYNTMREVAVWVQLDGQAEVALSYWDAEDPQNKERSESLTTSRRHGYTATLIAEMLEPGTEYNYEILINGKAADSGDTLGFKTQTLWHWRTDPPEFSFLAGSCMYINEPEYDRPGKPYGRSYSLLESMATEDAEFMVWLGDNTYFREVDWNSRSGLYHRYTHTRAVPELQGLLKKMHHYAIWDDHDYGPNDSDETYWLKDQALEAFKDFWANPNVGVNNQGGITGSFIWNDCHFFLLDNRWNRGRPGKEGLLLGKEQIDWVIKSLRYTQASLKFICVGGQVISDLDKFENHAVYKEERKYLLEQLDKYNLQGVVFLSGDRHSSEISKLVTEDGDVFYDITSSPLTSGSYDHKDEENNNR
ncbi:MAG: alkaline phosphatase family protein, partial [Saprospiraceae bacterium]|nr:alkaline phosphatase family protein [Saprospiraceae bacterium]